MKKICYLLSIAVLLIASISCTKEERFDYSMADLCGTWEGVAVKTSPDAGWTDITVYPFDKFAFSITFYSDGSYYGKGYFGNVDILSCLKARRFLDTSEDAYADAGLAPLSNSAMPCRRILFAARQSLSWTAPHTGQVQTLSDSFSSLLT